MRRRLGTWLAAVLLLTGVPAAAFDPLAPPPADSWRVWLLERADLTTPRALTASVEVMADNYRATVFAVGFERTATGRDLVDAQFTSYWAYATGGAYPRVTVDGSEPAPCPAQVLCSEPQGGNRYAIPFTAGSVPTTMAWYVVAIDLTVLGITVPAGWTLTELPPSSTDVHLLRTGTSVETRAAARADHFTYASQVAARGPSIAFGFIPCPWGPTGPMGPGEAVLDGGGPPSHFGPDRHPDCDYLEIGRAANDAPTTWTLSGEAAGLMPWPFHLVVVELP